MAVLVMSAFESSAVLLSILDALHALMKMKAGLISTSMLEPEDVTLMGT